MTLLSSVAGGLLCLLALTGCSGDDSPADPVTAEEGLPKAEYLAQSEAVCAKANADFAALEEAATPADLPGLVAQFQEGAGIASRATDELAALAQPQPDRAELEAQLIEPLQAQVAAFEAFGAQLEEAAAKGPEAIAAVPEPAEPTPVPSVDALRAYGFDACVEAASLE